MTSFTGLAVILGIGIGIGTSYWHFVKRYKRLVKQTMDILKSNKGEIPNIEPKKFDTFESEGGDVHEQPSKKEGEQTKEGSATAEPAPSSNIEEKNIKNEMNKQEVKKKK